MKHIVFAGILLAGLPGVFARCQNKQSKPPETATAHDHASGDHAHIYVCPMHPEVKSDQAGTCPKCNIALEERHADPTLFEMRFTAPKEAIAGKELTLIFTPKIKGNEASLVPLDVQHEKKIHLIVVSSDLASFEHIHPEFQEDGSYHVKTTFKQGGTFMLFTDYQPTGGDPQDRKSVV
jgi:hypothetical protein